MLNNQFIRAKKDRQLKDIEELFYKPIIVCKNDMDKLKEQEMQKIRSIKEDVMSKKPKMIRDKWRDKIINDTSTLFEKRKRKRRLENKEQKWKNN